MPKQTQLSGEMLTIGKVARLAEIGVETVRFYEREGLIRQPPRWGSGYREYPREAVERLRFIRRAKELGFTLKEIRALLALHEDEGATCEDVRARAQVRIVDLERRIEALCKMKGALEELTRACSGRGPTKNCSILSALEE